MVTDERFEGCKLPSGSYSARGAMGQFLVVIPEYDMVVVHQVDSDRKNKQLSSHAMGYILNKVFEAGNLSHIQYPYLQQTNLDNITGRYEIRKNIKINIFRENEKLYVEMPGSPKEMLIAVDRTTFVTTRNAITFKVMEDNSGKINVHLQQMDFDRIIKKL